MRRVRCSGAKIRGRTADELVQHGIRVQPEHPVLTREDFMGGFELAFYGWREDAAHQYYGPVNGTDLWSVRKLNHTAMVHLTESLWSLARADGFTLGFSLACFFW